MPILGDGTLERSIRLEVVRSIIDGWSPIHAICAGHTVVISTWSLSSQSGPSNTFTNMSTKVTIVLLWSLGGVRMKSSFIWTPATCLPVKEFGDYCASQCTRNIPTLSDFRFTFQTNS